MTTKKLVLLGFFLGWSLYGFSQTFTIYGTVKDSVDPEKSLDGMVFSRNENASALIVDNTYRLEGLKAGEHELIYQVWGYPVKKVKVTVVSGDVERNIIVAESVNELDPVSIRANRPFGSDKMPDVQGTGIFASKKTEVIIPKPDNINLAVNTPRQLFRSVPGLNIWESDAGGLQLGIGARGLNPNRTSNFNTRQNGYDISADALGYPESYYTPPSELIQRVELIRGAASLQYGPQFGGMLNFILDRGPDNTPIEYKGSLTYGSFNYMQIYQHVGGEKGRWKYAVGIQFKKGDGYRPNAEFEQLTSFASVGYKVSSKMDLTFDHTYMEYLAHQPGGLVDFEFKQDPYQSKRSRNWFNVQWNLDALEFDYRISRKWRFDSRLWVLHASRSSVGELGPINRPDPLRERNLIKGNYQNVGWENRALFRYKISKLRGKLSFGTRLYRGFTFNRQGFASSGSGPDFTYLNPEFPGTSSYRFPNLNLAFFAENIFHITDKWSITPGFRLEHIETNAKGYYQTRVYSGDEIIFRDTTTVRRRSTRSFPLLGIGSSYRLRPTLEIYSNFSQNYRSINFTDLVVSNPNLIVDSLLHDETGFNTDIGIRGVVWKDRIRMDISLFLLKYNNRIGIAETEWAGPDGITRLVAYRTNISSAVTRGVEAYAEMNIVNPRDSVFGGTVVFVNGSFMKGNYTKGRPEYDGNILEFVPNLGVKSGFTFRYRKVFISYQIAYTSKQYSDATNAVWVSDATRGIIPSYMVHDINVGLDLKRISFKGSINNLLNESYFTRRALSYPGPGIIPAAPRTFYLTVRYKVGKH